MCVTGDYVACDLVVPDMNKMVRAGLAVLSAAVLVTMVGYGTAAADDGGEGSIEGNGSSFGSFDFNAENDSDDPFDASGYFEGESPFGPAITLKGPITCLSIDGDRAGFIYEIEDSNPIFDGQEVKVSIEDGDTDRIGFGFAQPAGTNDDCDPGAADSEVNDGDITVDED